MAHCDGAVRVLRQQGGAQVSGILHLIAWRAAEVVNATLAVSEDAPLAVRMAGNVATWLCEASVVPGQHDRAMAVTDPGIYGYLLSCTGRDGSKCYYQGNNAWGTDRALACGWSSAERATDAARHWGRMLAVYVTVEVR